MTDDIDLDELRERLEQRLQDAGTPTALEQDAIEYAAQLEDEVEHTRDWYSVRIERLRDLCEEHDLLDEFSAIVANGTATPEEAPTYAQRINTLEAEVKRQEARAQDAEEMVDQAAKAIGEAEGVDRYEVHPDFGQTIRDIVDERDEARAELDHLHAQLERVCSEYEATWRVVREEGGTPPSVVDAREALREVKLGETIERIQRDARKEGAKAMVESIYERLCGYKPDMASWVSRHVRIEDALAEGDDQEGREEQGTKACPECGRDDVNTMGGSRTLYQHNEPDGSICDGSYKEAIDNQEGGDGA